VRRDRQLRIAHPGHFGLGLCPGAQASSPGGHRDRGGLLSWMLIWMTQQLRGLKAEVEQPMQVALNDLAIDHNASWGVFSLIFVAVLREGIETVLFVGAQIQQGWMSMPDAWGGDRCNDNRAINLERWAVD
jgi:Iron permease FTR1 family